MSNNFFYIAQFFTPEPYLKDIKFIKKIKDKGWNPIVITGFPNYPKGKIYDGYQNRLFSEETMDGIKVIRVFTYADHSLSSIKRTLNYLVFGIFAAFAILKYGRKDSFYYILQSSPFVVFCAWMVKLFKPNSKTLLDIQDVFPENIRVSGFIKSKRIISILDFLLDRFYYSAFDLFVTVSESFRKIINNKKIPFAKILTLYNWSMVESSEAAEERFSFSNKGFNIVYAGNIGVHQGLSKLTMGIKQITKKIPTIYFHFFGDGTDFSVLKCELQGSANVIFHGRVPSSQINKYMRASDVLFLHLIKDPIYECIIPSKLQAYIEIGKPLLAGIEGEARSFVTDNDLGEVFSSENNDEFQEAVCLLFKYSEMRIKNIEEKSKQLYKTKFSLQAGVELIDNFIKESYD